MSGATKLRAYALAQLGEEYEMGEEGPSEHDCSGLTYEVYRAGGAAWFPRETANDYKRRSRSIPRPANVGDLFFLMANHHAHHVGIYVGRGQVVEARGERWGVVLTTVAAVNARGAVWGRIPGAKFGRLTGKRWALRVSGFTHEGHKAHLNALARLHGARYDKTPSKQFPKDRKLDHWRPTGLKWEGRPTWIMTLGPLSWREARFLRRRMIRELHVPISKVRVL